MVKPAKDSWKSKQIAPSTSHNGRVCGATKNTFLNYVFEKEYMRQTKEWITNVESLRRKHLNKRAPSARGKYKSMTFTRVGLGTSLNRRSIRRQNHNNSNTSMFPRRSDGVGRLVNSDNTVSSPSIPTAHDVHRGTPRIQTGEWLH